MAKNSVEASLPHTAVATWGGYIYQGKIALYHCLSLMLENLVDSKKLVLQLDSIDDFAILLDGACQSMHQVKAYKSDEFSAYSGAISEQVKKSKAYPGCKVLFHVSKDVVLPADFSSVYSPAIFYSYKKDALIESYCALSEIDSLLENLICEFYIKYESGAKHKTVPDYLQWSRNLLEDIIVSKIISMHAEIQLSKGPVQRQVASREKISFVDFFSIFYLSS
ncbi:ABC-three component system protein [Pseudomonas sp. YNh]|uniref:ABC-three component system protein n=1 Tax=Pseudomonas sp. YNh TaxID=3133145 RepID=UPI0030F20C51